MKPFFVKTYNGSCDQTTLVNLKLCESLSSDGQQGISELQTVS